MKITKAQAMLAVRVAMARALETRTAVSVDLPGFEGFQLRVRLGRLHRIQQYPSKLVSLRASDGSTVWDCQAGDLDAIMARLVNKQVDGVLRPDWRASRAVEVAS